MDRLTPRRQSSNLSPLNNLEALDGTGLKVDVKGRAKDWAERPGHIAHPTLATPPRDQKRKRKKGFTTQDEQHIIQWCSAAEEEGVLRGSDVFQQLECLRQSHSWQAYEGKWRRGDLSSRPRPGLDTNAPFPNLMTSSTDRHPVEHHAGTSDANESRDFQLPGAAHSADLDTPITDTAQNQESLHLDPTEDTLTYSDYRVDIAHRLYRRLGLADEDAFIELLRQDWVVDACIEYTSVFLVPICMSEGKSPLDHGSTLRSSQGKSPHRWKIARAIEVIKDGGSRYMGPPATLDKALWTADDHDVRFMVVLVQNALLHESNWSSELPAGVESVAEKVFWLMLWMRWIYQPVLGTSAEMQRIKRLKQHWRLLLSELGSARISSNALVQDSSQEAVASSSRSAIQPQLETTPVLSVTELGMMVDPQNVAKDADRPSNLTANAMTSSSDTCPLCSTRTVAGSTQNCEHVLQVPESLSATDHTHNPGATAQVVPARDGSETCSPQPSPSPTHTGWSREPAAKPPKQPVPEYMPLLAKNKNQNKGTFWLTEDAYTVYKNHRDSRMAGWGVRAEHAGTCILVKQEWANVTPEHIMDTFKWEDLNSDERHRFSREEKSRLYLNIGEISVAWARASVWFESWPEKPRRGIELDAFFPGQDGPFQEMHGSHLCHHGLCINKNHLIGESPAINQSRNECAVVARNLRAYGIPIPEKCVKHPEVSCLLQHASLTTHEALLLQFNVLRQSRNQPASPKPARPNDHPSSLPTFETCLPLSFAPMVSVREEDLVSTATTHSNVFEKFTVRCPFCASVQQRWSQITAYWSHLKLLHEERSRVERLAEVRSSAKSYMDWIQARYSDYERSNPDTWIKLQQAVATNFDWQVLQSWRLNMDRHYERWVANAIQN